jgi:glycosyltransferase involved in cell wall biosynthesis
MYGVEPYIVNFAESLLSQSYPHIEFVFVNDGTKDRSVELLEEVIERKFAHLKPQIKIVHKANGGLPAARLTGLDNATGDYIYHADSDDWLEEGAIEKIAQKIEATDADIVYFDFYKEYPSKCKPKRERDYAIDAQREYVRNMYNHRSFGTLCNKCIRRALFLENNIIVPKYGYAEDCFVTTQLVGYAKSIAYLDEVVYHYRKGNSSAMTGQQRRKRKREYALNFLDLYQRYCDVPTEHNPIAPILDDIVLQAGWYSLFYRLDLFSAYPWLASHIRHAKLRRNSNVWLVSQLLTKIYALFK